MTTSHPQDANSTATPDPQHDAGSDYGDFGDDVEELTIVEEILARIAAEDASGEQEIPLQVTDIEDVESPRGLYLPRILGCEVHNYAFSTQAQVDIEVLRDRQSENLAARNSPQRSTSKQPTADVPPEDDKRSPLEKFRKPPKKALSVTDLISPAWCELQYHYTLSKHGRKKRTPAMKQGTAVHQALEDEVHTTVPITVTTKEDSWGLRIWNITQGLMTLRETGRTRELEIWGTVGGEIVNGVIDELTHECPDPSHDERASVRKDPKVELPEYQTSITDYLTSTAQPGPQQTMTEAVNPAVKSKQNERQIYIIDVKTRNTPTLPAGSSIRPTILQLHLYHHMLENLAQGNFHLSQLADRYDLDVNATFSDSFIAQIGSLNQDLYEQASSQSSQPLNSSQLASSQDSMDILLTHNNLSRLWDHMISQFRTTFLLTPPHHQSINEDTQLFTSTPHSTSDLPSPPSQPTRLSSLLTATYLASPSYKHSTSSTSPASTTRPKPMLLGHKSITFNPHFLQSYLQESLSWWRGDRSAKGVELHEAWKCRSCDYRNDCVWIHERDEAALREVMERKALREPVAGGSGSGSGSGKTDGVVERGSTDARGDQTGGVGGGATRRSNV